MVAQEQEPKPLVTPEALLTVHGRICDEFGRVEGLRQSMLSYVPGFTVLFGGASIFVGAITNNLIIKNFLVAIGFLGMFTTFALFIRELLLDYESFDLAEQGRKYQRMLHIPETMFTERESYRLLTIGISTTLIYASSFTGWFCVATWFAWPGKAIIAAIFVMLGITIINWLLRNWIVVVHIKLQRAHRMSASTA